MPTQSIVSMMTVDQVEVWPDNRELLEPLWGKPVALTSTTGRESYVEQRSFRLLTCVRVSLIEQQNLPEEMRDVIRIQHSWIETTQDKKKFSFNEGTDIKSLAVVIKYRRKDGSESFGFRITGSVSPDKILQAITRSALSEIIEAVETHRSPTSIFNSIQTYIETISREMMITPHKYVPEHAHGRVLNPGSHGMNAISRHLVKRIKKWAQLSRHCRYEDLFKVIDRFLAFKY